MYCPNPKASLNWKGSIPSLVIPIPSLVIADVSDIKKRYWLNSFCTDEFFFSTHCYHIDSHFSYRIILSRYYHFFLSCKLFIFVCYYFYSFLFLSKLFLFLFSYLFYIGSEMRTIMFFYYSYFFIVNYSIIRFFFLLFCSLKGSVLFENMCYMISENSI